MISKAQQIIKFNVGGQVFAVSKSTLLKIPSTYFTGMVNHPPDFEGNQEALYFITNEDEIFNRSMTNQMLFRCLLPRSRSQAFWNCDELSSKWRSDPRWTGR